MNRQTKIRLENGTILLLGAAAFVLLAASLLPSYAMSEKVRSYLEMNRMVERAFAAMLLVLSLQLMKRKKAAWEMTVAVLALSLLRGLGEMIHTGPGRGNIFILVQACIFLILLWCRKDFCSPASKRSLKQAFGFALLSLMGVSVDLYSGSGDPCIPAMDGKSRQNSIGSAACQNLIKSLQPESLLLSDSGR